MKGLFKSVSVVGLWSVVAAGQSLKTPNIGGEALFLCRNSNSAQEHQSTERNGIQLQEAELHFYSDVDPYSRLQMIFSLHPEYEADATKNRVNQTWAFEPEELYAESNHVSRLTIKIGKFKAAMGKHNIFHSHNYPFVDAPLFQSQLLGSEGLNDVGASASALLPTNWFSEATLQILNGEAENQEFNSRSPGDSVCLVHLRNLVDFDDSLTGEWGMSYAGGANNLGGHTSIQGTDLTVKWKPTTGGRNHSGILAMEYLQRKQEQLGGPSEVGRGLALWTQYYLTSRFSARARYETLKVIDSDATTDYALANDLTTKYSTAVQFDASEFSFFRLEYDTSHGPKNTKGQSDEQKIYMQFNFTIGSHPAHNY